MLGLHLHLALNNLNCGDHSLTELSQFSGEEVWHCAKEQHVPFEVCDSM